MIAFLPLLLYPLSWRAVTIHTLTEREAGAQLSSKQSTEASGTLGLGRFRQCSAPIGFVRDSSTLSKRKVFINQLRNNQTSFNNARRAVVLLYMKMANTVVALGLFGCGARKINGIQSWVYTEINLITNQTHTHSYNYILFLFSPCLFLQNFKEDEQINYYLHFWELL